MIVLADTPIFILKRLLAKKTVRAWIYLGQNAGLIDKVCSFLPDAQLIDIARQLDHVSNIKRSCFVSWIDEIAKSGRNSPEWFFSVPSVKNPANSTLFLQMCYFFVFKELSSRRDIDLVIVDSKALLICIIRCFSNITTPWLTWLIGFWGDLRAVARTCGRFFLYMTNFLSIFLVARTTLKDRAKVLLRNKKKIVLIRSYITENFTNIENDILEKRYFPGLYDFLAQQDKTPVFLPIVIQTKNYSVLFKNVLKSQTRIIFVEEFLTWRDYLRLFFAPVKALACRIKAPLVEGHDLHEIVGDEYLCNISEHGFLLAVLCSCLGKGLEENEIFPESVINWSEYQAFEKGLIAGLRESFPAIRVVAAHPFCIPPNHLCLIPSQQEKLLNIVPDRTLVLGDVGKKIVTQYLRDLPVEYSPLFRYGNVFKQTSSNPCAKDILALFGFSFSNAIHTLHMLAGMDSASQLASRVLIKLHPLSNFDENSLRAALKKPLPDNFHFIEGQLEDWLHCVAVGVCGATGTSVELAVRGIPVIIVAETYTLTMNYLAFQEDRNLWRVCYGLDDFNETLQFFFRLRSEHPDILQESARLYAKAYFAQPNRNYYENLL